jgi:hypothetical protein
MHAYDNDRHQKTMSMQGCKVDVDECIVHTLYGLIMLTLT